MDSRQIPTANPGRVHGTNPVKLFVDQKDETITWSNPKDNQPLAVDEVVVTDYTYSPGFLAYLYLNDRLQGCLYFKRGTVLVLDEHPT